MSKLLVLSKFAWFFIFLKIFLYKILPTSLINDILALVFVGSIYPVKELSVLKGHACYIFVSLFFKSKGEHMGNKDKCFLFHFKSYFVLEKIIF